MTQLVKRSSDNSGVTTLKLNRPDMHNAFNAELIAELTQTFDRLSASPPRVLVLTGAGKSFSAGADLGWMQAMADAGEAENRTDSERLAAMFRKLDELPCPTPPRNAAATTGASDTADRKSTR